MGRIQTNQRKVKQGGGHTNYYLSDNILNNWPYGEINIVPNEELEFVFYGSYCYVRAVCLAKNILLPEIIMVSECISA